MSSDDSICTLRSPKKNGHGFEWRVRDLHSIQWDYNDCQIKNGNIDEMLIHARRDFGECKVFGTEEEAEAFEDELDNLLQASGLPEYGPTALSLTHPLWVDPWDKSE